MELSLSTSCAIEGVPESDCVSLIQPFSQVSEAARQDISGCYVVKVKGLEVVNELVGEECLEHCSENGAIRPFVGSRSISYISGRF